MIFDRLETALRRYAEIRPKSDQPPPKSGELDVWIDDQVCPIIEELLARADFQELARWPIDHLAPSCGTPERTSIETVDRALVGAAKSLFELGRQPEVASKLASSNEFAARAPAGEPTFPDTHPPVDLSMIETIAQRPWSDLVAVEDYFGPLAYLNLRPEFRHSSDEPVVQLADFLPAFNPRLRRCGDFVVRMLFIRIDVAATTLQQFWSRCRSVQIEAKRGQKALQNGEIVMHDLAEKIGELRHTLRNYGPAKVREACLSLVQVYAAYRPSERLMWLEEIGQLAGGACHLRYLVEQRDDTTVPELVAAALAEVQQLYRSPQDAESLLRRCCEMHSLVLIEGIGRREAFWKGAPLSVQWNRNTALWEFLWGLAQNLKAAGLGLDHFDMGSSAKDHRSRLRRNLPSELDEAIVPAGRGTYRLELQSVDVCCLHFDQSERLVEVSAPSGFP